VTTKRIGKSILEKTLTRWPVFVDHFSLNGIDPEAYLRHILSVLPEWPSNRVDELLPWNVVLTNK
ncbi:transposase domain-containing protein, partial [Escherichia coli]|nr:transposase domain-containing protein [Escherichia coli]